jgi:predicted RNA-binding protein (virulence factor B family)
MDWGLMKDLFVPKSQQLNPMRPNGEYLVKIYLDEQTGRVAATERFDESLSNDLLTVKPMDKVQLIVYRRYRYWLCCYHQQSTHRGTSP